MLITPQETLPGKRKIKLTDKVKNQDGKNRHTRTGRGARGAAAPPNFGQLRFFGQQEKIWSKPAFKDVFMFFLLVF